MFPAYLAAINFNTIFGNTGWTKKTKNMKLLPLLSSLLAASFSAVMVILTITNLSYLMDRTNAFIPFLIMLVFSALSGMASWVFILEWNRLFLK